MSIFHIFHRSLRSEVLLLRNLHRIPCLSLLCFSTEAQLTGYLSPQALMSGSRVTNSFLANTISLSTPLMPSR
jgi:hypothetical protein